MKLPSKYIAKISKSLNKNRSCIETIPRKPAYLADLCWIRTEAVLKHQCHDSIEDNRQSWIRTEAVLKPADKIASKAITAGWIRTEAVLKHVHVYSVQSFCRWIRTEAVLKPFWYFFNQTDFQLNKNRSCIETVCSIRPFFVDWSWIRTEAVLKPKR